MFIKIYFGDKPLFLCDELDSTIEPFVHHDDAVFIDELDPHTVKSMIHEMQQEKIHAGVFKHDKLDDLKKAFWKKFTLVKAAGGLVVNENNDILMIYRRGKWDLPKGKLDEGETLEQCAVREVQEETGLKNVSIQSSLLVTYHTYHEGTKFILKESHWYNMKSMGIEELVPQTEEGIEQIKWADKNDTVLYLQNTFPSIKDVLLADASKSQQ